MWARERMKAGAVSKQQTLHFQPVTSGCSSPFLAGIPKYQTNCGGEMQVSCCEGCDGNSVDSLG